MAEVVFRTLGEVARYFGRAEQTVKQWRTATPPMPGSQGRYPLRAIAQWLAQRFDAKQPSAQASEQKEKLEVAKLAIAVKRQQLLYEQLAGQLVAVDQVARLFERTINEHNAQIDQLKDRVLSLVPEDLSPTDRRRLLKGITKAVEDLKHQMADAAAGWGTDEDAENETDA